MTLVPSSPRCLLIILEGNQEFPPFPLGRKRALTWLLSGHGSTAKSVCLLQRTPNVSFAWPEHRIRALVLLNNIPNLWAGNTQKHTSVVLPFAPRLGVPEDCEQRPTFPLKLLPVSEMASGAMNAGVPAVLESWASFPSN